MKILNALNRLKYVEMRKSHKSLEARGKIPSEIHITYASPEVMRKKGCFYKKDEVYPFTHAAPSNKEEKNVDEKVQICKKCGSLVSSGQIFCAKCGSPIQENDNLSMGPVYASPDRM